MGKPEDWGSLDKYEEEKKEKKGFFAKLWGKTVFPEKIKKYKEEKRAKEELHHQAKMEAMAEVKEDMKEALKQKYKQEEIDKITGVDKQKKLKKFADAFSLGGTGIGSTEKIEKMLGTGRQPPVVNYDEARPRLKRKKKAVKKKQNKKPKKSEYDFEEKIKRML